MPKRESKTIESGGNVSKCRKAEEIGLRRQYVNGLCRRPNNRKPLARAFRTLGRNAGEEYIANALIRVAEARASFRGDLWYERASLQIDLIVVDT